MLETKRLILRPWEESDAENLYKYASSPDVGPIAGWPPHRSIEDSRYVIENVLCGKECYAVCLKTDNHAIGSIELKLNGHTDMTDKDNECELGYWIGKEFWGQGLIPEAARELMRRGFEDLNMNIIWCGYYEGNVKSKRVQEKLGFIYHHTCNDVPVPLLNEIRVGHTSFITKDYWLKNKYSEKPCTVREIRENELYELLELYMFLHEKSVPEMSEHLKNMWETILQDKNHHIIVNEIDNKIVSTCVCVIIPNLSRGIRPHAFIEHVVTHEKYRGKGYATECLNYAKEIAQKENCYKILLATGSKEESTLKFYENAGYNSTDKTAFVQWL